MKKLMIMITAILLIGLTSCEKTKNNVVSDFYFMEMEMVDGELEAKGELNLSDTTLYVGDSLYLINRSVYSDGDKYLWDIEGTISTEHHPIATFNTSGIKTIILTSKHYLDETQTHTIYKKIIIE